MATPIDATLAAFITQAIREAMAEERRQDSYDNRRRMARDESRRSSAREERRHHEPSKWPIFGTETLRPACSRSKLTSEPTPFTWGFPWEPTTQPTTMNNTKKVNIVEPEPETHRTQSRYGFSIPSTAASTFTNTSNSGVSNAQTPMNIPNRDNHIKLVFGKDNIIKPNPTAQTNKNTCCETEPRQRPPQPSYPPPVYSDLPELVSDSESTGDEDEQPKSATTKQQETPNENKGLSDLFNAALGQEFTDRDTINGILTSLLGADMTRELENLADEMLGTSGVPEPNEPKQEQPTATAREVCIAYKALRKYANEVIKLNLYVDAVIFRYLQDMLRERLFDANILRRTTLFGPERFDQDTHKGVVKAICAELSISNRFSAIEDMIKNMPYSELMRFQKTWWFDCNDLPEQ